MFVQTCVGFTTSQLHTDHNTNGSAENAARWVKGDASALLVQSGLSGKWCEKQSNASAGREPYKTKLADRKSPYETRFGTSLDGPVILFGAYFSKIQSLRKRKKSSSSA